MDVTASIATKSVTIEIVNSNQASTGVSAGSPALVCQQMVVAKKANFFNEIESGDTPKQHLHEIENDLIAGHYHSHRSPPAMQFSNAKLARDQREA